MEKKRSVGVIIMGAFMIICALYVLVFTPIPLPQRIASIRNNLTSAEKAATIEKAEFERKFILSIQPAYIFGRLVVTPFLLLGGIGIIRKKYKLARFTLVGTFLQIVLFTFPALLYKILTGYTFSDAFALVDYALYFFIPLLMFIIAAIFFTRPKVKEQFATTEARKDQEG